MNMERIDELVTQLKMIPHPEGGYFAETYRSSQFTATPKGNRPCSTAIYFLLTAGNFSAFHRIASDECWHHYEGDTVLVHIISPSGEYNMLQLGSDFAKGERPQGIVPAGYWFASESTGPQGYALVGCTVAPGFDFQDFELADPQKLVHQYPERATLIERLTR
jgi:predicted cupin superfamily sugar epimerase